MRMLFSASSHEDLVEIVRSVRLRWRLRVFLRGLGILLAVAVVALLFSAYGMDLFRFDDTAVLWFRIVTYTTLVLVFVRILVLPLLKRVSDERVALYLEEHEPSLSGHVMTGIELGPNAEADGKTLRSPALVKHLVRRAIEKCVSVDEGRRIERKSLWGSSGLVAGAAVVGMAFFLVNPPFLRHGAPFLLSPLGGTETTNPYSIEVIPGDISVARGSDVRLSATLRNFEAADVDVAVRRGEAGGWERWPMIVDDKTGEHVLMLFDLEDPTEYFIEASGVRSQIFRIDVSDLPYVDDINLVYHFPAYTGLSPRRQEGSGDIAALSGTRVSVEIVATMAVTGGALVLDETDTTAVQIGEDGTLTGNIIVAREGRYRVLLQTPATGVVVGSPDYYIDVLADMPPSVYFEKPGRDITVTSIEEVFTQVNGEDDYGIGELSLVYSVNGGEEQTVSLYGGRGSRRELSASHTFYLEEIELQPGDIISYHARAVEVVRGGSEQEASSDIYFMEVRPFDRTYRQAESQGGQRQGSGAGNRNDLSAQQREIIAGTFNLLRDRWRYTDAEFEENLTTLALAQGRAREEVATLSGRIQGRGITQFDSTFVAISNALDTAAVAMEVAEELLREGDPREALSPEQRALQFLLRAEALYGETEVSQQQGGGGGGGGEQANAEDLADLFELELDRMRNQYEEVQRGRREQTDQELDEVMQRLRDLARRQQQQNERMRAQQQNMERQSAGGGGGAEGQRRLADEAEELARQLERLSREEDRPDLQQTARDLREAAEAMRRAAANSRNSGVAQGVEALDELREARRLLDRNRTARLERDAQEALRRVEQLAEQQRQMVEDVNDLTNDLRERREAVPPLQERKGTMAEEVDEIEADLDRLARDLGQDQRDASRMLEAASRSIRDNQLQEKLLWSRGVIQDRSAEYAQDLEAQIETDIEELNDLVRQGVGAIGETQGQRLEGALENTRDAVTGLESMAERLRQRMQEAQQGQETQEGQGGGGGRLSGEDQRQFTREFRERLQELSELRRQLAQEGVDAGELEDVINQMGGMDRRGVIGRALGVTLLESEVIQGLKEFEFNLRRRLQLEGDQRLYLSGSDAVPEGYRELVEEYYRELARRQGGDSGRR